MTKTTTKIQFIHTFSHFLKLKLEKSHENAYTYTSVNEDGVRGEGGVTFRIMYKIKATTEYTYLRTVHQIVFT